MHWSKLFNLLLSKTCWIFCHPWFRGSTQDVATSLPEDLSDPSEGEVLRMSSALPTMWLGAQNGWWARLWPLEGSIPSAANDQAWLSSCWFVYRIKPVSIMVLFLSSSNNSLWAVIHNPFLHQLCNLQLVWQHCSSASDGFSFAFVCLFSLSQVCMSTRLWPDGGSASMPLNWKTPSSA